MEKQHLIDFADWLWDMDRLKVTTQLPPFENSGMMVELYLKAKMLNDECEGKADRTSEKDLRVCSVSGSWLDFDPFINENSKIEGLIIKHDGGERWGKVAIKTCFGNFAVVSENYEEAVKRIGSRVKVKPDKERYYCVSILEYHDR